MLLRQSRAGVATALPALLLPFLLLLFATPTTAATPAGKKGGTLPDQAARETGGTSGKKGGTPPGRAAGVTGGTSETAAAKKGGTSPDEAVGKKGGTSAKAREEGGLSEAERRGKAIYLTGESDGGEIQALMGEGGIEVPATALPCSSCHGRDGRGRPEGGVEPSDLTWEALTRPYQVVTATGRERGPYTPRLLKRAITLGVDASGQELDAVMPRYRLSHQQAEDLVAYLRKLGKDLDPGVSDDALTLGVLLPPREERKLQFLADAIASVVDGYVDRVNAGGGVYHRRLEVHYLPLPSDPAARPEALRQFATRVEPFALVASFTAGADAALADAAEELQLPVVGALTLHPDESFPLNRYVFYVDGGLPAQLRALLAAPSPEAPDDGPEGGGRILAILHPEEEALATAAEAARKEAEEDRGTDGPTFIATRRLPYPTGTFDAASLVERLRGEGVTDVLLLIPGPEEAEFLAAAARTGWAPRVLIAGAFAGPELFRPHPGFRGRLLLGLNTLPLDRTPPGARHFEEATGGTGLPLDTPRISTFLALELLLDGLEETGRDLTREGLIEHLELVRGRPTGLGRPQYFGPNRRVAVRGAYVVELDPAAPEAPVDVRWVEAGR